MNITYIDVAWSHALLNLKRDFAYIHFIGTDDVLGWMPVGMESTQYITGFTLSTTNQTTKTPVYYLSLKAENGAGLVSGSTVSTPIMVMEEDKAGTYKVTKFIPKTFLRISVMQRREISKCF